MSVLCYNEYLHTSFENHLHINARPIETDDFDLGHYAYEGGLNGTLLVPGPARQPLIQYNPKYSWKYLFAFSIASLSWIYSFYSSSFTLRSFLFLSLSYLVPGILASIDPTVPRPALTYSIKIQCLFSRLQVAWQPPTALYKHS